MVKRFVRRWLAYGIAKVPRGVLIDQAHFEIFQSAGFHIVPVHFYSVIPNTAEIDPSIWEKASELRGIDQNVEGQSALLRELSSVGYLDEFYSLPADSAAPHLYGRNGGFGDEDGALLYSLIRKFRPARIIEIGAGQTTLLSSLALGANGVSDARLTTIDPYPPTYLMDLDANFELIAEKVENIPLSLFEELNANDILFIDSTHALRVGGDVCFEILEILPRLNRGVVIHIHDIFLPRHYPKEWVLNRHNFWTEQYLVQAFLSFNDCFKIIWSYGIMYAARPDVLSASFRRPPAFGNGSSLWLMKVR
jgi:predicted O-methyltransferase YrrM